MSQVNGTMMQFFHWYIPADGKLWDEFKDKAAELANAGFTAMWLPPAYKASGGGYDVGYGVYDLFDLGEFDQKGTIPTKYGTREQFLAAVKAGQDAGMQVYADVVLNHKNGGDETEKVQAVAYYADNRTQRVVDDNGSEEIETWSKFTFPGRGDKYSSMKWQWWHFDAVNYNQKRPDEQPKKVYLFQGKSFDNMVNLEKGNYDFLLGCDLDFDHEQVRSELMYWGEWLLDNTGVNGFRLDAIKHIPSWFFVQWLDHLRRYAGQNLFCVGEYWQNDIETLHWYISATEGKMSLIDVPLHYNFHHASKAGGDYDMRRILDGTLMQQQPDLAVTFVDNHYTQPGSELESWVEPWFKPLAYAIILLRREGYPCVFYGDYYGDRYRRDDGLDATMYSHRFLIDKFLFARKAYGFGDQHDYFDHPNTIGWTRLGNSAHPGSMAVVLTNGSDGYKWMNMFRPNVEYSDITGHFGESETVKTNSDGWGRFPCRGGKVSVWLQK